MTSWWKTLPNLVDEVRDLNEKNMLTTEIGMGNVHIDDRELAVPIPKVEPIQGVSGKYLIRRKNMADKIIVDMEDGSTQEFGAKQKMLKFSKTEGGITTTRMEFSNGRIITFEMPASLKDRFAEHGADQKFGDVTAGIKEVDDCVLAVEDLAARLATGEWSMKREGNAFAGTSVLVQALVLKTGKPVDVIKEFLSGKTQAQKVALRNSDAIRPFVEQVEASKVSKGPKINTDELLAELE